MFSGTSWRGNDGEDDMTQEDWGRRGQEQGLAAREGGDPFLSSPDADGTPTGGDYNGDYPDSWHNELNERLEKDEYYEAEVDSQVRELYDNR